MSNNATVMTDIPVAPMVIRGEVISDDLVEVGGRGGDLRFLAPDAKRYVQRLALATPSLMADLYELSFEDILDYLEELGSHLYPERNEHLRLARELSYQTSPTTAPIVDASYAALPDLFRRENVRENTEHTVGVRYLEGWVPQTTLNGQTYEVRCFGARTLHIVAGNSPVISAVTIIRNAVMRSDAIIKAPSNDPFTALAIARTMVDIAPNHPITRHLTVAYWRGGDREVEEVLYRPEKIEKIVAWGGFASVKYVAQYIQPGLELISFDPKRSMSIVGPEAFETEETMREAAMRVASDVGAINQVGCINARVIYGLCGTDEAGVATLERFGKYVHEAMLTLPPAYSTKPKNYNRDLRANVDALRHSEDWYTVIGGDDDEGAIIVSKLPEPVDFAITLNDRTANLVPADDLDQVVSAVNSYTQTVGVYPESLKQKLLDILPLYGAQRFVSLGYAISQSLASPQDSIEPMRRMGKWISNEICTPETFTPPWLP